MASKKKKPATRSKAPKSPTHQVAVPATGFLDLSAELRNRVYLYSLIKETPILISKNFKPPALLQVNQQIRGEAKIMYYDSRNNKFRIKVWSQKADNLIHFAKYIHTLPPKKIEVDLTVDTYGVASITRLMKWCKAIWEDEGVDALEPSEELNPLRNAIVRITKLAEGCRGKEWKDFEVVLKAMRETDAEVMETFPIGNARYRRVENWKQSVKDCFEAETRDLEYTSMRM